jgi:hypothetical protein
MFGYEEQNTRLLESEILNDNTICWIVRARISQQIHINMFGQQADNISYYLNTLTTNMEVKLKEYNSR